jgi:hypothetical protein
MEKCLVDGEFEISAENSSGTGAYLLLHNRLIKCKQASSYRSFAAEIVGGTRFQIHVC